MNNPSNRGPVTTPSLGPRPAVNMPPLHPTPPTNGNVQGLAIAVRSQLQNFADQTDIKRQLTQPAAIKAQENLWKTIQLVLNRPPNEFPELWGVLLDFVHQHSKDVFHANYVFRGIPYVTTMGPGVKKNYIRIMQMAMKTADPTTRAAVSRLIDFKHIGRQFKDPSWGNKLSDFYRV